MIKKIGAITLALVLCLSVFVLPGSAAGFDSDYSLQEGNRLALRVELDKESYSAGDIATISIYAYADDDLEYGAGAITIGVNKSVFNTTDNTANTIKASATSNDAYNSFYKSASNSVWAFLDNPTNTNVKKIIANNTEEENAMYDAYVKVVVARDMSGSHENAASNVNGIYGSDINADSAPILTFQLKVAADVADGTEVNVGIPSGTYTGGAAQTYMNVFEDPGNSTKATKTDGTTTDVSAAKVQATIGEVASSIVEYSKTQIRFHGITSTTSPKADYTDAFDVRTVAKISEANFQSTFADDDEAAAAMIAEAGFVYAVKSKVPTMDYKTAQEVAEGKTTADYYEKVPVQYMQHANGEYIFTCLITDIADNTQTSYRNDGISCIAYVKGTDGTYHYLSGVQVVNYADLFTAHFPKA